MRERGCAVNVEESEDGVASVAVAVHGPRLAPAAALAVSGPVSRMTGEVIGRIEAELRERAAWLESRSAGLAEAVYPVRKVRRSPDMGSGFHPP